MSNLIRQLKLHSLLAKARPTVLSYGEPSVVGEKALTDGRAAIIVKFFDELFDGMVAEIIPSYDKKNILYHKGGKFYMEQGDEWLWCRMDGFWIFFERIMLLDHVETMGVVKYMVGKYIKKQVGIPCIEVHNQSMRADRHIKKHITTLVPAGARFNITAENQSI